MSFYTTTVAQLTTEHLQSLLDDNAVENARLEFKLEVASKDETLKKISAFANAFGGSIIIGARANSSDGRLTDLAGVAAQPGYKQTIVQWCFDAISPPLIAEVSDPIPVPAGGGKVCYVIRTGESEVAPHFLNGRKGIYVRTDESSGRFEARLANEMELRHLFDRRRIVRERRSGLITRARSRFTNYARRKIGLSESDHRTGGPRLDISIGPRFPASPLCDHGALVQFVMREAITWRQTRFPRLSGDIITQHESAILLQAAEDFSLFEANIWGMTFYGTRIDIRVAAYRDGDQWRCAFAALRFTADSPTVIRGRFEHFRQRHGIIKTDVFMVVCQAIPFRQWKTLAMDIDAGKLRVGGQDFFLKTAGPIGAEMNYLRTSQQHDFSRDRIPWPSLDISRGENPVGPLNTDEVTKAIGGAGYSSAFQVIAAVCEVNAWPNNGYGHNFFLRLPVFTSFGPVRADPITRKLHFDIRRHKKLTKTVARSLLTGTRWGVPQDRKVIDCQPIEGQSGEIQTLIGSVPTPDESTDHFVEISLSHPDIGEIERQNHRVYDLLPAGERNPLFEVLKRFCPEAEIESMLITPGTQSAKGDQSAAFEQHVAWLLSLLGFSPIVLGKHEHLKSGKVQVASIDIIGVRGKVLLLTACTMAAPKSEDFVALWHAQSIIVNEVLAGTTVSVAPLILLCYKT